MEIGFPKWRHICGDLRTKWDRVSHREERDNHWKSPETPRAHFRFKVLGGSSLPQEPAH